MSSGAGAYEEFLIANTSDLKPTATPTPKKWMWVLGAALLCVSVLVVWGMCERGAGAGLIKENDPFFSSFKTILSGGGRVTP